MNDMPSPRKMQPNKEAILGISKKKASSIVERWPRHVIAASELQVLTQFLAQSGIQSRIGATLGFGLASRAS